MNREVLQRRELTSQLTQLVRNLENDLIDFGGGGDVLSTSELFKSGAMRGWLLQIVDVLHERWESLLSVRAPESLPTDFEGNQLVFPPAMERIDSLLETVQSEDWNRAIVEAISKYVSGSANCEAETKYLHPTDATNVHFNDVNQARRIVCSQTYLPKPCMALLHADTFFRFLRWDVRPTWTERCDLQRRSQITFQPGIETFGSFAHFARTMMPLLIPQSTVESLHYAVKSTENLSITGIAAVFTANLHLSSDTFVIWLASLRKQGIKIVLSQHGGLYGQGAIPTRGAEFEQWFADTYFHWGWCSAPNAVKVPAQITMWKRKRRKSNNRKYMVLVTDCTFRFSRRPWPCDEENRRYRSMLLSSFGSIPSRVTENVIVRLHHDHDKYDDSHSEMWRNAYPTVNLDDGLGPIDKLRKRARLMVSMSLGTSEIEQFARNIPTILRIDPVVHVLRESCVDLFADMERVGLVHWSDESFSSFLDEKWDDIDAWWTSAPVREVVGRYLDQFGYQSKKPFREFRAALKAAAAS